MFYTEDNTLLMIIFLIPNQIGPLIMRSNAAITTSTANKFDSWRSISIALYMALVGYSVMVSIPVISTAWVSMLGFTEEQVGRVAGADLGGLSIGAVITAMFVSRVNRRLLVLIGVAVAITSNALCMVYVDYQTVLWLRVAAGIGSGIYTSVAVVSLGGTSNPARSYNLLLFAFAFSTALELYLLPKLSMNGIYLTFIGLYVLGLFFIFWVPSKPQAINEQPESDQKQQSSNWKVKSFLPWICLTAMFFTYINIGGYWTYIELASLKQNIAADWIGKLLVWTSLFSILGCLLATALSNRYGLFKPLILSLIAMMSIVGMLSGGITTTNIMISLFSFNLLWIFIDVYQMSMIARMDRSGSLAALVPGAQGLGQIVGPNIAASVLGAELGYNTLFMVCASMVMVAIILYTAVFIYIRLNQPSLAEAT
ncbi:MAG: putative MFS family arabinose efflux permease [Enterobacterales bacterium]